MKSFAKRTLHTLIRFTYVATGGYISYIRRPVRAETIAHLPRSVTTAKKFAVLLQGPLKLEDSFTLETVRLYKKTLLPSTHIIVSTWEDEDEYTLQELRNLGAHVITAKQPENQGILHVNYQITSVKNAIHLAEELGVEYLLKSRTDTRMYATNIEEYLCGLLTAFPSLDTYKQKYRILGLSLNSNLYRMYNISDLVMFGHISDMTTFWDVALDQRTTEPARPKNTLREWSELRMVETFLTSKYLEKIGRTLQWTVADSFKALGENFIIIDEQSLDLFWYKYGYWKEYRKKDYRKMKNDMYITFRDWVALYANGDNLSDIPEHAVELPFEAEITKNHDRN